MDRALAVLQRTGRLKVWYDRRILGGEDWNGVIEDKLTSSDLVFLLLSPDFFSSDYCFNREMREALVRQNQNQTHVIPVIVRPVSGWDRTELGRLQVVPKDAKAVTEWANRDTAWRDVAEAITRLLDALETAPGQDGAQAAAPSPPTPAPPPPPPAVTAAATQQLKEGLELLRGLMKEPAVRSAVTAFRKDFENCREQVALMADYKDIHDQLHQLQRCCYDSIAPEARKFPDDEIARDTLTSYGGDLTAIAAELRQIGQRQSDAAAEAKRIADDLDRIDKAYDDALASNDAGKLNAVLRNLGRLLSLRPSRINTRLNDTARSLPLGELLGGLMAIQGRLVALQAALEDLQQFDQAVTGLKTLQDALDKITANHDQWQEADDEMRLIESNPDQLDDAWPSVALKLQALCVGSDEPWAKSMADTVTKLNAAIAAGDPARARRLFQLVRRGQADRFYRVDTLLKRQCDELRAVAAPLDSVLSLME
ncbi:MAG: toll/interleukin-1 receptor domain-containing protein [Bryobacterales bacterium]|nr:toll/interleukin-1 receptor domain-containing protein [Bryobacterales bacterium]